jgi:hypothetical protein
MTATISDPEATPAPQGPEHEVDTADLAGVTLELRALLTRYTEELDSVTNAPMVSWVTPGKPWLPHWLAVPAPRYFVSAIFTRYLYRCADALKSGVMRRNVVSGTADEQNDDLKLLKHFEESLPRKLRLGFNLPVGLLVVLSVAYVLAWWCQAGYRNLLGDLMAAAISVNRSAVFAAFDNADRLAKLQGSLEPYFFAGAAMIVAWSAVAAIVPLLPAVYVVKRKRARITELEEPAFAALGARVVHEVELDLIFRLLLIPAVALLGVAAVTQAVTANSINIRIASGVIAAISVALTILAAIELGACYRERRHKTARCRSLATKVSFAIVAAVSTCLFVILPIWLRIDNHDKNVWDQQVAKQAPVPGDKDHTRGWLTDQLSFLVTDIQQNAQCIEPHGILIDHAQYLQFDLEVWSDVDQFANQATAYALALPHWSVRDRRGKSTGSLYMHAQCGHGTAAIVQPIVPGTHSITAVVVSAPRDATCLELDIPSYRGVWRWPILPATGGCKFD